MDSPNGAMDHSHETSIMPPPLPPSRYRGIEYDEETEQIERPHTKTISRPRSASMDTRGRPVRPRGSSQDISDLVRELEDVARQLKKQEEEKEKEKGEMKSMKKERESEYC